MKLKTLVDEQFLSSLRDAFRYRQQFRDVRSCCLFLGYPRSGGSLVGALLNAHRHAVIAQELNVLKYLETGYRGAQVYSLILKRDRWFHERGQKWTGYDYTVPNQWQGRFESLRVIGDKRGWSTSRALDRKPELLDFLRRSIPDPIRFVHPVRNPFDNITTMFRRFKRSPSLEAVIDKYFETARANAGLIRRIGAENVHHHRHEDLIADPRAALARLCAFLDLDASQEYLDDCAGILFKEPSRSRLKIEWTPELICSVETRIAEFPFLHGYSFES